MNTIKKRLRLSREEYYKKHLLIINPLLPVQMTPREAEVLAAFLALEGDLAKDPFSTTGRKIVRQKCGISAGGLGNYLDQFKEKELVIEDGRTLKILPVLIPERDEQGYQFKLEVDGI